MPFLKYNLGPVKRICVFEHSVMTNFNCACLAIQRGQGSGFLSEGSSWLTACMSEQRRFWRDCADAQARLNLRCLHRRQVPNWLDAVHLISEYIRPDKVLHECLKQFFITSSLTYISLYWTTVPFQEFFSEMFLEKCPPTTMLTSVAEIFKKHCLWRCLLYLRAKVDVRQK